MIPATPMQVLQLTQDPDVSIKDIVQVMGRDPILAAKVLKVANLSVPQEVPSLSKAVVILGMRRVSTLALGVSLSATFGQVHSQSECLDGVWRRSLYSALAGRMLSAETRAALDDEAFLGGLFQDVGILGILATLGQEYEDLLAGVEDHEWLVDAERDALGTDHACVGAAMAEAWSMPQQLVTSIACHHYPENALQADQPMTRLVWASRVAANVLLSEDTDGAVYVASSALGAHFGLGSAQLQDLLKRLAREAEKLAELFDVKVLSEAEVIQTLAQAQDALIQAALDADAEAEQLRGLNRELAESAGHDRLTGLQNRTRLEEVKGPLFEQAKEDGSSLAALFIDADRFKSINDMYGHGIGDEVLQRIGQAVMQCCGDQAFRFGGEEILCLLPDCDREQAAATAEDIRQAVEAEDIDGGDFVVKVTVSVGVAVMNADSSVANVEELTDAADRALYAAKDAGRNRVCVGDTAATPCQ